MTHTHTHHTPTLRGRFAPTPSGRMHLGNVWCALVAWLDVRSRGGTLVLRIEDLDPRKTPTGAVDSLLDDLAWLGLTWDEGPIYQSERREIYEEYLQRLISSGLTYPCFCARADLHAAEAPHASDGTPLYAGTCRTLTKAQIAEKSAQRTPGIRLRVPEKDNPDCTVSFSDTVYGAQAEHLASECGDFLVRRSDGVYAYQLAVTVDDALMGITSVIRGRDLLPSCARQIYIQQLLGFETPTYAHVPLLMAADGSRRLSKRDHDCDLGFMREHFGTAEVLLGRLAHLMGLTATSEPISARELAQSFSWDLIQAHTVDTPVTSAFFN